MAHTNRSDTLGAALDPAVEQTVKAVVMPRLEWARDNDPVLYAKAIRLWHEHGGLLRVGLSLSITSLESLLHTESAPEELRDVAERGFENLPAAFDRAMRGVAIPPLPENTLPATLFEAPRLYTHLLLKKRLDERLSVMLPQNEWTRWVNENQPIAFRATVRDIGDRIKRGSNRLVALDQEVCDEYYAEHPERNPVVQRQRRAHQATQRQQRRDRRQRRWSNVKTAVRNRLPRWIREL